MAQFSMKIRRQTGSLLGGNQHRKFRKSIPNTPKALLTSDSILRSKPEISESESKKIRDFPAVTVFEASKLYEFQPNFAN